MLIAKFDYKTYNGLDFLNRIKEKDPIRSWENKILIRTYKEEQYGYATDGKRLHRAKIYIVENGIYSIAKSKEGFHLEKEEGITFPDVDNVTPEVQPNPFIIDLSCKDINLMVGELIYRFAELECFINPNFLKDLKGWTWRISFTKPDEAVRFDNDSMHALIAPMNVDKFIIDSFIKE